MSNCHDKEEEKDAMPVEKAVRLGIIGFGNQGSFYAELISDGGVPKMTVGAIADVDPDRLAVAAETHPEVALFDRWIDLVESDEVDAIVTTVPHYLHPEIGIAALERGVHCIVEKPAGVYTKQVAELNAVAGRHPDVVFAIMFNQRANPLYGKVKEVVEKGEIGAIRRSNWIMTTWWRPQSYYDLSAWRATWGGEGGGVLVNQAPHQLDLWQWICGMPKSVFAKVACGFRREIDVENDVAAVVDYGDGATGVFVTATHDLTGTDRFEIIGDAGKIVVDDSKRVTIHRLHEPETVVNGQISTKDVRKLLSGDLDMKSKCTTETIEFESKWGVEHGHVLTNFATAILDGSPLLAPGTDGINGVRLANAILLSGWTGAEVGLDFDDEEFLGLLNRKIADEAKFDQRC